MEQETVNAKNWVLLERPSETGQDGAFVNLDLVQSVEIISQNSLKLRFSETQTISIEGPTAVDLVKYLMTKTVRLKQPSQT